MKLISPALLIEALAARYPDCAVHISPEVFADFVTEYAKDSGFDIPLAQVLTCYGDHIEPSGAVEITPSGKRLVVPAPLLECSVEQPGQPQPFMAPHRPRCAGCNRLFTPTPQRPTLCFDCHEARQL